MAETSFDLVVLGGGPGGYVAAIRAAQLKMKVALIEREHLGGICLNWGCIPTKTMLRSAEIYEVIKHAEDYGLTVQDQGFNLSRIIDRSRNIAAQLNAGVSHLLKKNSVTVFDGNARLAGPGKVQVGKVALDAKNIIQHVEEEKPEGIENESVEQIAFADIVLLNKTDLVETEDLVRVEDRIRKINAYAKIIRTERCEAALDEIIGLNAFSLDRVLEVEPDFLTSDHDHEHDDDVKSMSLVTNVPLDLEKFQTWFGELLQTKGPDILRSKGILNFKGEDDRFVFQGVHMLMDGAPMGAWPEGARQSRLVFIGRNLDTMGLEDGFAACQAA